MDIRSTITFRSATSSLGSIHITQSSTSSNSRSLDHIMKDIWEYVQQVYLPAQRTRTNIYHQDRPTYGFLLGLYLTRGS
eukprot:2970726-Amphidinium_carterae.1